MAEDNFVGDHWAYFGDGEAAMILESREYESKVGIKHVKFIFLPSRRIEEIYAHEISEKQDPSSRAVVMDYKSSDVMWLQRSPKRSRVWVFTDFIGRSTPASRRYEELTVAINDTDRLIRSAEAAKNRAYYELETERQQQQLALRSKVDAVREVARARGKIDNQSSDDDYVNGDD